MFKSKPHLHCDERAAPAHVSGRSARLQRAPLREYLPCLFRTRRFNRFTNRQGLFYQMDSSILLFQVIESQPHIEQGIPFSLAVADLSRNGKLSFIELDGFA